MSNADILRIPCGAGSLHAERYGFGGQPVVLLHGFGTASFLWRYVGPLLAAHGCTAWSIDMLGHGESDRPVDGDYGVRAQGEAVENALAALRLSRATLVGVDVGALVALRIAVDRPSLVSRLVLVSPQPPTDPAGAAVRELQRKSARYVLATTGGSLLGAMPLFESFFDGMGGVPLDRRAIGRYLAPFLGRPGLDHLLLLARALEAEEVADLVPQTIGQPALIVRGSRDPACTKESVGGLLSACAHGRLVEVEGAGRLVPESDPGALVEACRAA